MNRSGFLNHLVCQVIELPTYQVHNKHNSGYSVNGFGSYERVCNVGTYNHTHVKRGERQSHTYTCLRALIHNRIHIHTSSIDTNLHTIMQYTQTYTLTLQHRNTYATHAGISHASAHKITHIYTLTYTHTHINTHTRTHTYAHTHSHIYVYTNTLLTCNHIEKERGGERER